MEDELIRIFATGAVQWLMSKAMPDDEPIDMKMISKAVERAQNTVEQRNAEIRKDVLKYDEVLDAQRKVIYKRRMQVIDGGDLREETMEILQSAVEEAVVGVLPDRLPRGLGPHRPAAHRHRVLPDEVHRRGARPGRRARRADREHHRRGHRLLRAARSARPPSASASPTCGARSSAR